MKRSSNILLVILLFLLSASFAASQTRSFDGGTTFVNTVEVPVRVVDAATGEFVSGLGPEDFRILEDGEPMEITGFYEAARQLQQAAAARPELRQAKHDLLVFVDLYLATRPDKKRAVEGLERALESGLLDGHTRLAIVSYNGSLTVHCDYSDDLGILEDALAAVAASDTRGLQTALAMDTTFDPFFARRGDRYYRSFNEHRFVYGQYWYELRRRMEVLNDAVSASLARFATGTARRSLLLLSPGYPKAPAIGHTGFEIWNPARLAAEGRLLERVGLEAAELGFTVFTSDTTGVRGPEWGSAEYGHQQFSLREPRDASNEMDRRANAIALAELTGGRAFFHPDVRRAVNAATQELEAYYSLAYSAPHHGDGRVHEIEVLLVPELDVEMTYRRAYLDRPAAAREADVLRAELLNDEPGDNPLGVEVWFGEAESTFRLGAGGMKRVLLPMEIRIPYAELGLIRRGHIYWGQLRLVLLNVSPQGDQSPTTTILEDITLGADELAEARSRGHFVYTTSLALEGGKSSIRIAVSDELGGTSSTLEIPLDL